jgi:hypothetical protein
MRMRIRLPRPPFCSQGTRRCRLPLRPPARRRGNEAVHFWHFGRPVCARSWRWMVVDDGTEVGDGWPRKPARIGMFASGRLAVFCRQRPIGFHSFPPALSTLKPWVSSKVRLAWPSGRDADGDLTFSVAGDASKGASLFKTRCAQVRSRPGQLAPLLTLKHSAIPPRKVQRADVEPHSDPDVSWLGGGNKVGPK